MIDYGLARKVVIVTGAAGAIGCAIVRALIAEAALVVGVDIDAAGLAALAANITGDNFLPIEADVSTVAGTENYVAATVERFGRIDGLVNNAGIIGPRVPLLDLDPADFDRIMAINARSALLGQQHVMRRMIAQGGGGAIVNIASIGAMKPARSKASGYPASKAAVIALSDQAAVAGGPYGIRVNCVCPGGIDSDMITTENRGPAANTPYAKQPVPRLGRPAEVADMVLFLLGDRATYVTGGVHNIDGGALVA
ncbi:MAG: SDR family oxidoreductase [Rhizobiaceae bacterium]|nr:SDR family oxidoreductase [Rhizobiaceae bacterium]